VNVILFQPAIKPHLSVILKDGVVYWFDDARTLGRVGQLNIVAPNLSTQQNAPFILAPFVCQFLPARLDGKTSLQGPNPKRRGLNT
jgi:hypothetical protein